MGRVRPGSPAARAGLQPGDIIVAIAGQPVDSATAVERMLRRLEPQRPVPVRIYRNGRISELMLDPQLTWEKEKPHV